MWLYEYEARKLLEEYGVPLEPASYARSADEVEEAVARVPPPYVIKAQVLTTSRAKKGGIRFADTPTEAIKAALEILSLKNLGGAKIQGVLIAHRVSIERELYLAFTVNRSQRCYTLLASPLGGSGIEERERETLSIAIDPLEGLQPYMVRRVISFLGTRGDKAKQLACIVQSLYRLFADYKCMLVEVNPLAETANSLVAIDRRVILDDSFVAINSKLVALLTSTRGTAPSRHEFSYVELDGDIAVIGNGAGLTMSTMDLVSLYGGRPACFLDIGGGASAERVARALELVLSKDKVKVVLINVLGGITRCDEVAKGIIAALSKAPGKRIVVRLCGTNEEEGRRILSEFGVEVFDDMETAAKAAVRVAGYGGAS